jgi:hypothetical protein
MSEMINNGQARKEALKKLILELHAGGNLDEIKARFRTLVGEVSAVEIAQMEQALIAEGLPVEEVKKLCDVHVAVFRDGLGADAPPQMTPGHPVHTFKYENFAAGEVLTLLEEAISALPATEALARARVHAEQLAELNRLYLRKENLLFPFLEKHGVSGPSSVMWAIHDDVRAQLKALRQALADGQAASAKQLLGPLANTIRQLFFKEENILYPTALKVLTEGEWVAIRDQSDSIGYCLVRPGEQWQPQAAPAEALPQARAYGEAGVATGEIKLDTGLLTAEQINLLLRNLPVDVTFVDETDTVRYFSQTRERVFQRDAAIIGRKVQNCHPPKSVHVVNRILEDFRAGKRDVAEFWIQMAGKFIHIRYLALHDADGVYRGTIEVSQEVSGIRVLEGERRILDELK